MLSPCSADRGESEVDNRGAGIRLRDAVCGCAAPPDGKVAGMSWPVGCGSVGRCTLAGAPGAW
ncbi:hypothetical protein GCM10022222_04200 [Amycolatopsis ultiminotia]|uniref:Uncharacterized protein n=1 Tax=Amycolatopsis ultiminotia TaxID=543629 RepID=A0ABP6UXJ8_9PSEU